MPDLIADVGMFGATGSLPSGAGPVDPPILTSGGGGGGYTPVPNWQFANLTPSQAIENYYGSIYNTGVFGPAPQVPPQPSDWVTSLLNGVNPYTGQSTGGGVSPAQGYVPSDIMQAYMDFYQNNPQAAGATAPGEYPSPGDNPEPAPQPSFGRRIVNNIPAVRLARLLGNLIPRESWQHNAASRTGPVQGPPAIPPGGALFGYNPAQGGGTPHYDPGTGRVTNTPSLNPLYTTGGAFQPVANAPQDIRWAPNSGTGNAQASATTDAFVRSGGYAGAPNRGGPDVRNSFDPRVSVGGIDPETGMVVRTNSSSVDPTQAFRMPQRSNAPTPYGDPASQAAYNEWLMQQPEYQANPRWGATAATNALDPFAWLNVPGATTSPSTIASPNSSGPPPIPRWLQGAV